MPSVKRVPLTILQGSTFSHLYQWAQSSKTFKDITAITKAAPPVLTVTGHGAPDGWEVYVGNVGGMEDINSDDAYLATLINANSLSLPIDATGFDAYTSGGVLSYYTPVDLSGYTARAQFRASITSTTVLVSLTTENAGIVLDNTKKTITLTMTAAATAALTWKAAFYDLELVSAGGVVSRIASGPVTVSPEVTR